jgi:hypothetical protein
VVGVWELGTVDTACGVLLWGCEVCFEGGAEEEWWALRGLVPSRSLSG